MSTRNIDLNGRKVTLIEEGTGEPIVYLHGFADVHGVAGELLAFHKTLAGTGKLIAPAHPGCNGSDELEDGTSVEDVVFHYLELFDALSLKQFTLVGHCAGGWIAAEIAVRHPERVKKLVLIGACGLFVPGELIEDIFMHAQPERGVDYKTLRNVLFSSSTARDALRYFPDGRGDLDEETRRYAMLRFGSFVGFKPPYFYNRSLINRLHRATMPSLVLWGEQDHMVPRAHGEAYAKGLKGAGDLQIVSGAGHAAAIEGEAAVSKAVGAFLKA
ncbi:alpha/beta hydrolase [Roseiarcaceae bacterium H3SJ34-1]|uniref:alpha/beta fold hydrolase n=1 Tax=Terripilifer ovatus TaxID=3032367 RepID=UPI003AB99397|nr:alpha/beta hydrolase [Roseiarcaceae bacterium H3SJ34-1]